MSTELRLAAWTDTPNLSSDAAPAPIRFRTLIPASKRPRHIRTFSERFTPWGLAFVLLLHAAVFFALVGLVTEHAPIQEDSAPPMLVSLVESPVVQPPAPEPKPVVEPKPQPVIKKPTPRPQEKPTPVVQNEPSPVAESVPQETAPPPPVAAASPVAAKPAEVVEKPQPVEPPKPEVVTSVSYLRKPELMFPAISRRLGEEGTVIIRVLVSEAGEPASMEVRKTSGYPRLDQAGIEAVKKARFIPPKKNNKPMSVYVDLPLTFSLTDE